MTILILGSTGLVGSSLMRLLSDEKEEVIGHSSANLDLRQREMVFDFFRRCSPKTVILAAAKVGGIFDNSVHPTAFLSDNLLIQTNVLDACHAVGVQKVVFLGSSCIYPRDCPQPIKEESLLTGPLESTNSAYAIAKISGIELVRAYRKEFKRPWISLMPSNLYGPGDNFDLEKSHVLPALIRKFSDAVNENRESVTLWGTGQPRREFLHVDDFARAVMCALRRYDNDMVLNVGSGVDITIRELASIVASIAGFKGEILWDTTRPDGTPRKLLDVSRIQELGWSPRIGLEEGIIQTVEWYRSSMLKG